MVNRRIESKQESNGGSLSGAESFDRVLREELKEIGDSREFRNLCFFTKKKKGFRLPPVTANDNAYISAADSQLMGVALSGGGIRSATFNLGILQGLARYNLLQRVDYLSTVSGGGYIGSWLATWIGREGIETVVHNLNKSSLTTSALSDADDGDSELGTPEECETEEIGFLRRYSNYLTPRVGFFNADTISAATIYLRNLFLNLTILSLILGSFLLVPQIHLIISEKLFLIKFPYFKVFLIAGILLSYWSIFLIHLNLKNFSKHATSEDSWYQGKDFIIFGICFPVFLTAMLITYSIESDPEFWKNYYSFLLPIPVLILNPFFLQWPPNKKWSLFGLYKIFLFLATFLGLLGARWLAALFCKWQSPETTVVLGAPLTITLFSLCGVLYIGLMGAKFETEHREWLSRFGAWLFIFGLSYLIWWSISIGVPLLNENMFSEKTLTEYPVLKKFNWLAFFGWAFTSVGGVIAAKSSSADRKITQMGFKLLTIITPYIFIIGLTILLSIISNVIFKELVQEWKWLKDYQILKAVILFLMGIFIALFMSLRVDVNDFSMHNFYRNRLIRCYIGASDKNRNPNPFIGFDTSEHCIKLSELCTAAKEEAGSARCPNYENLTYAGPYPIINTTINLVAGDNLAWQKRKGASFVLTPLFCGYDITKSELKPGKTILRRIIQWVAGPNNDADNSLPSWLTGLKNWLKDKGEPLEHIGYRPTKEYSRDMSLGTAMAVSGAAISPNMGHFTNPALAVLMTLFNLRLGQWMGNPRHKKTWVKKGPRLGLLYLLFELFGKTNERRGYVYLSDGGHFENLGLYELIRRRCRYIIVCDAGQDKSMNFRDLGTAIDKCRSDFGVDIEVNVDPICLRPDSGRSNTYCVVGKIKYGKSELQDKNGFLLYIKSTLTGDEPTDVLSYASQNENFPHQSTSDQWFDEAQFESYRALGRHIAVSVFQPIVEKKIISDWSTERIFISLSQHWYPPSEAVSSSFTKHATALTKIVDRIRNDDNLKYLDAEIFPQLRQLKPEAFKEPIYSQDLCITERQWRSGFYVCYQMLQLMENIYIDLNLEEEFDHPDNRGWMNMFHQLSWSLIFRATWSITAGTFGSRFQSFCERRVDMMIGELEIDTTEELSFEKDQVQKNINDLYTKRKINRVERKMLEILLKKLEPELKTGIGLRYFPIKIKVSVLNKKQSLLFQCGFALMKDSTDQANTEYLVFFRIQNHLRKMGYGRHALVALLKKREHMKVLFSEDYIPKEIELFKNDLDLKRFRVMFDSVKKGIVHRLKI